MANMTHASRLGMLASIAKCGSMVGEVSADDAKVNCLACLAMIRDRAAAEAATPNPIAQVRLEIVKFTASWCPPCKAAKRPLAAWVLKHPGVTVREVDADTDEGQAEMDEYRARSLPTFLAFRPIACGDCGKPATWAIKPDQREPLCVDCLTRRPILPPNHTTLVQKPIGRSIGFGNSAELHEWLDKMLAKASTP